jgi:cyanuric acid amidohydrolase
VPGIRAYPIDTAEPGDVSALRRLFDEGIVRADDVVCVVGKTEGNGGRNDFTRQLAATALEHLFAPRLGCAPEVVQDRVVFSLSGGTEGVATPHIIVFARDDAVPVEGEKRLAVGSGVTRAFTPDEIGRMPQITETARVIRDVVASLDVDSPTDVHLVQMKGAIPPFTHAAADAAVRAGTPLRCDMMHSRAASALATALALDEIAPDVVSDDSVCRDWSLSSGVASCSAKPGQLRTQIVVFAMSASWGGDLVIDHGVLSDILDVDSIRAVAARLGLSDGDSERIVGVFAKSEADPRGTVRGRRHTMLDDDDISDTRYARCVLAAVLAATLGDPRVYVSTRAEHHGPVGGGPLAIIARVPT